jgi:hypothetical protein
VDAAAYGENSPALLEKTADMKETHSGREYQGMPSKEPRQDGHERPASG